MSGENPYGGKAEPPEEPESPPVPGTPGPAPYGGYPTFPPGNAPVPVPPRDTWKIWLGIGLAIPVLIATSVLAAGLGSVDASGAASGIIGLAGLVGPIVMLFFRSTRKLGLGLLIGYAVFFILAAGACVVLLASYADGG